MGRRGNFEGSIYKRESDGRWAGVITVDGGKRKYFYGKTRKEVAEKMKVGLRDQQQGALVTSPDQPFGQFLSRWLEDSVKPSVKIKTFENYSRQVRVHIGPSLGNVRLSKLSAQHLQRFYRQMLDLGLASGSVERQHSIIHRALSQALSWNLVARNVADLADPPRPNPKEMLPLSSEQAAQFLKAARSDRFFALYCLAISTGMRQAELLGLTWPDVEFGSATLHVHQQLIYSPGLGFSFSEPKTAKSRRAIDIPAFAVEALREHRKRQLEDRLKTGSLWEDHDLVFANEVGRFVERGNLVRRSFLPLLEKAGLPRIRFHDLRHTAATILLKQGTHPKVVQERLGHSSISVTMDVYSHVLPSMQREAADGLDTLFSAI